MRGNLVELLTRLGQEVVDIGGHGAEPVDYPDVAAQVGRKVAAGEVDRGILICGSGLGMCIAANKVKGIRAGLAVNEFMAIRSRQHNDANILCLGARIIGPALAFEIVKAFSAAEFSDEERHKRRLRKIEEMERGN